MLPSNFSVLENVQAIAQQNHVVVGLIGRHNIAATVNIKSDCPP